VKKVIDESGIDSLQDVFSKFQLDTSVTISKIAGDEGFLTPVEASYYRRKGRDCRISIK
jgi:hypothetical protein